MKLFYVLALVAVVTPAMAGPYQRQCDNFLCRNKLGMVCPTSKGMTHGLKSCDAYFPDNGFSRIVVLQEVRGTCQIVDGHHVGWTDCQELQFDTDAPVRR